MATGTETVAAGEQRLDSFPTYIVYVPKSAVGKQRVPLVVYLHGGGGTSKLTFDEERDFADRYGMILLAPEAHSDGWDILYRSSYGGYSGLNPARLVSKEMTGAFDDARAFDGALKAMLQKYAIDPDKIAIAGFSDGGSYALFIGRNNEDVFSRVVGLSPFENFDGSYGPRNATTQFLVAGGIGEGAVAQAMSVTEALRNEGHGVVETILGLRGHTLLPEDNEYVWGWLARSWGWKPPSAEPKVARPVPDTDPVLTPAMIQKMTTFWSSFTQEPDEVRQTARRANQEVITMTVGQVPVTVVKTNMKVLAAQSPAVASDLKQAGLTAEDHETYRIALIRVAFARLAGTLAGTTPAGSALAKNLEFFDANKSDMKALESADLWTMP